MADRPMLRVIAYDIASDRRRVRVASLLEDMAARVQESVFEVRLNHGQARRLMARLRRMTDRGDRLRLYTVPDTQLERCEALGGPAIADGARYWIV